MLRVDTNKHCSFNNAIRQLFYMKQNINNSITYTEEEKLLLTKKIEDDICNAWEKVKYELNRKKR